MDTRLLLIRICSLLFLERALGSEMSKDLVNVALEHVRPANKALSSEVGRDTSTALIDMINDTMSQDHNTPIDRGDYLQRARVCCTNDSYLFDALSDYIILDETSLEELERKSRHVRREIAHFNTIQATRRVAKFFYGKAIDADNIKMAQEAVNAVREQLDQINFSVSRDKHPAITETISLKSGGNLKDAFERGKEEVSLAGVIRFGWQALNRMFGQNRGGRRGETIAIGALEHNFKSGFSLELLKSGALYNYPFMIDASKKPMLLRITGENSALQDTLQLYKSLKENELGIEIDQNSVDPEEAEEYVIRRLGATGYHVEIVKVNPTIFTYIDLFDLIKSYEADGYEIHMCNVDYLNLFSKDGCTAGAQGENVRDLFRRVRNFMEEHRILFITPHQLSSDAARLLRLGVEDFVKNLPGKKYWDSCSNIGQEVDMEIYIHIVESNGRHYLTVQRGKHRKFTITPNEDRYFVRRFEKVGGILDDVNGPDLTRRRVGASTLAEGGALAFHQEI